MDKWEHMAVAVEQAGGVQQLVATSATGPQKTSPQVGLIALLGLLDELGSEGWQLVNVDQGVHWLRRPRENQRSNKGVFV